VGVGHERRAKALLSTSALVTTTLATLQRPPASKSAKQPPGVMATTLANWLNRAHPGLLATTPANLQAYWRRLRLIGGRISPANWLNREAGMHHGIPNFVFSHIGDHGL
jgi:hypothetical protein